MSDTIETATLYERHMRSSSRSDEEQLQIEFRPVTATSDPHWYEGCRQALPARGKHFKSKCPGRTSSVCRSAVARRFQSLPPSSTASAATFPPLCACCPHLQSYSPATPCVCTKRLSQRDLHLQKRQQGFRKALIASTCCSAMLQNF